MNTHFSNILKGTYYEKHVFSSLNIYTVVLPQPADSGKEESNQVLHCLCSLAACGSL